MDKQSNNISHETGKKKDREWKKKIDGCKVIENFFIVRSYGILGVRLVCMREK